jgi:Tfp pilus assembly protein PilN
MINLLPPEVKQDYRYARRNRHMLHWILAMVFAVAGVAILTASGMVIMDRSIDKHKTEIAQAQEELASQNDTAVQQEVTAVSNNLRLMVTVLSKEILFSQLLVQLGNTTPPNVILTNLSISQAESGIDITARATNYNAATQLQANLADPDNKIFSKADIVSISCGAAEGEGITANYPCSSTIRAQFSEDNPFLFINTDKAGQ